MSILNKNKMHNIFSKAKYMVFLSFTVDNLAINVYNIGYTLIKGALSYE